MSGSATSSVDASYLERAAELLAAPKRAGLQASAPLGGRVLDVGCGPGIDTVALARMVGVDGAVDGVDADPAMIAAADRRVAAEGDLWERVHHCVGRADELPWPDATFDAVRAERVLQHLPQPLAAVREMVRATRPGGTVVLVDTDWASLSVSGGDPDVERVLVAELCRMVPSPTAGRDLRALLARAGCVAVAVTPFVAAFTELALARLVAQMAVVEDRSVAAGRVRTDELERWRADCVELDALGGFYGHAIVNVAVARVPQ